MTRVAPAAMSILTQATALRPRRSRASDGTVGDRAHRNRVSDHNPDSRGIVHAADLTHDPKNGMDAHAWAKWLAEKRDRRVKYIISNRRIWEPAYGWSKYGGENPHDKHVHVSVVARFENDTAPWFAGFLTPPNYVPPTTPVPPVQRVPAPTPPVSVAPPAAPPAYTPPDPQETAMEIVVLSYPSRPNPLEYWLAYSDGKRTMLHPTDDLPTFFGAGYPVRNIAGEDNCNRWKNFTSERPYGTPW